MGKVTRNYQVGDAVYAEYLGPCRNRQPRWVPAIVTKRLGSRSVNVKVVPQLHPRYTNEDDINPPEDVTSDININTEITVPPSDHPIDLAEDLQPVPTAPQFQVPDPEYGPNNHNIQSGHISQDKR